MGILSVCTGFSLSHLIALGGSLGGYIDRHHRGGLAGDQDQAPAPDGNGAVIGAGGRGLSMQRTER